FAGAVADRFGTVRVISAGAILYALGLVLMANARTPGLLDLSAGVLIGFGLSGCSFNIVLAAFGKLVPESWRSLSLGAGTAAGSFGQFLFSPLGVLFIALGSLAAGWLGNRRWKPYLLSVIYFARALAIATFVLLPASTPATLAFGAAMGLLWLSTVPPTSGLVALMFGTRWLAMLFGFAFFSHQVGGFLGVWLGGILFERTGSYDAVWWISVLFGVLSALINLPIVEKPVARAIPAAA